MNVDRLNEKSSVKCITVDHSPNCPPGRKALIDHWVPGQVGSVGPKHFDEEEEREGSDSDECYSWDEDDDEMDVDVRVIERRNSEETMDLLVFAREATSRLKSLMCRNEGQEGYVPVYEDSNKEEKKGAELYYSNLLGIARLNETFGSGESNYSTGKDVTSIPSDSRTRPPEFEILTSSCHWECTGRPKREVGLGPLEELFSPVVLLTANNNAFYEGSSSRSSRLQEEASQRSYYYDDDKLYELLMAGEASDATNDFWNRSCVEKASVVNNFPDFPNSLYF